MRFILFTIWEIYLSSCSYRILNRKDSILKRSIGTYIVSTPVYLPHPDKPLVTKLAKCRLARFEHHWDNDDELSGMEASARYFLVPTYAYR